MSTQSPTTAQIDNATLIEKVSFPVFYRDMTQYGYGPNSPEGAEQLTKTAGVVAPAVEAFVARRLSAMQNAKSAAVDMALGAALEATAELHGTPPSPQIDPRAFFVDPAIKAAAERIAAEQLKAAGLADMMGPNSKTKEEEEEEEEKAKMKDMKECPA